MHNRTHSLKFTWLYSLLVVLFFAGVAVGQDGADYTSALHYEGKYEDESISFFDFKIRGTIGYLITYNGLQVFDFADTFTPQLLCNVWAIDGVFVELSGEYAYISAHEGIIVVDISDPANAHIVGQTEIEDPGLELIKCGNFVYTSDLNGLARIDVTDPASPFETSPLVLAEGYHKPIASVNNKLIVSSREKLSIVDVTDPEIPVILDTFNFDQLGPNDHLDTKYVVADDLIFMIKRRYWETEEMVHILDISNPSEIVTAGRWYYPDTLPPVNPWGANASYANGYLYYMNMIGGLFVIDVSNPANPVTTQHLRDEFIGTHERTAIHISGDMLYALSFGYIHFVGIESHSVVRPLGLFDTGEYVYCLADAPALNNTCLVGTDLNFQIVDHSQPASPIITGSLNIAARDIHSVGNTAYVAANSEGFYAIDITEKTNPAIVGTLDISAENVTRQGQYAYIKGDNRLYVVDISNPDQLSIVGQCPYEPPVALQTRDFAKKAKNARAATTHTGSISISGSTVLLIESYHNWYEDEYWFNIEDPTNPYLFHSRYSDDPGFWVCGLGVDYRDNIIISTSGGHRAARDVSDPSNPILFPLSDPGGNFARSGNLLYMINNTGEEFRYGHPTVRLVDASDPTRLPVIGAAYIDDTAMSYDELTEGSIVVSGDHVVTSWGNELYFLPRHCDDVVPVFLSGFNVSANRGSVNITWATQGAGNDGEFKLTGRQVGAVVPTNWEVPYSQEFGNSYVAQDTQTELAAGGSIEYSLYYKENSGPWAMIDSRTIELEMPGVTCHLTLVHPNPFNPLTNINFFVSKKQRVSIDVYDLAGRKLAVLSDQIFTSGQNTVSWDGKDTSGRDVSSGTYFVQLKADDGFDTTKITLVR